jgi:hypothetical protein
LKHWKHLRFSSGFIQAALYTATPRLLEAANHALSECPDKREMLKYMTRSFGIKMEGHPGVTRLAQVEAIVPYLDDLDAMAISDFWNLCNERGWTSFRKAHLDARLTDHWRNRSGLDDTLIMDELHQELKHDREPWMDVWVDDQLKNGVDRGRLLQVVGAWLKCNQTPRALEVAASIVIHAGTRHDADVLVAGDDGSELASQIIADTRYAIMRRSLH